MNHLCELKPLGNPKLAHSLGEHVAANRTDSRPRPRRFVPAGYILIHRFPSLTAFELTSAPAKERRCGAVKGRCSVPGSGSRWSSPANERLSAAAAARERCSDPAKERLSGRPAIERRTGTPENGPLSAPVGTGRRQGITVHVSSRPDSPYSGYTVRTIT